MLFKSYSQASRSQGEVINGNVPVLALSDSCLNHKSEVSRILRLGQGNLSFPPYVVILVVAWPWTEQELHLAVMAENKR